VKWTRGEILQMMQGVTFDEDVEIDADAFTDQYRINAVKDVHVSGEGHPDSDADHFYVNMEITGVMLCPDAITGKEIEVPFETECEEVYSFIEEEDTEDDGMRCVTTDVIELLPAVIENILLEVPLQVTEAEEGDYPEGDGWKIYSEAEYQESRKDQIDPRLAKLKQFKIEE